MRLLAHLLVVCLALAQDAAVAEENSVDYAAQIKPLLRQKCYACHGALKQEGGLRLDTAAAARRGGDSGPAVVAGKPNASLVIERVTASDESMRMPREATPLIAAEIDLLRQWIAGGASGPAGEHPEASPQQHWAFQPPMRPPLTWSARFASGSSHEGAIPKGAIDGFVEQKLAEHELAPLGPAPRHVQLRRVYLDLIGLPPSREELAVFLADERPDAYDRVVDRLLASPQHGERWARHWMDVWRYSDWYGRRSVPDVMNSYPQIWRWRDWIVRSLNSGRDYDQMVLAMLAADELWPEDQEQLAATGFIVRNWFKWNYDTWMRDQVEHTGKAFLGLTLNCALCHDHKYDPISQQEYFRFRAIFEPLELRHERVPGQADPGPFKKYVYAESYGPIATGMIRVFDEKLDAQTFAYRGGDQRNKLDQPPVPPGVPAFLGGERFVVKPIELPPAAYYPGLREFVRREELAKRQAAVVAAAAAVKTSLAAFEQATAAASKSAVFDELAAKALAVSERNAAVAEANHAAATSELAGLAARVAADRVRYGLAAGDAQATAIAASRAEREAKVAAAQAQVAAAALALSQAEILPGDDKRPPAIAAAMQKLAAGEQALAAASAELANDVAAYTPLSPLYSAQSTGRRTALAHWIVDRHNPLTPRVAVNHIWRWHFGQPIVPTTANFGTSGKPPSHPELLDWLAVEFMDGQWEFKRLHRQLVTSDAYRRASEVQGFNVQGPAAESTLNLEPGTLNSASSDPDNRWLWRANAQRMEAEVARDSLLSVAGELDAALGGPEIDHAQGLASRRRSLYFAHHGEGKMELLELLDGASPTDCYERSTSIRPQQALALANSDLTRELAGKLTARLGQPPVDDAAFAAAAFEQVLCRPATAAESAAAVRFLTDQRELYRQNAVTEPETRSRSSLVHVLLNHHDFLTIR